MTPRTSTIILSVSIGIVITAALSIAAYYSHDAGAEFVSRILLWPNTVLQSAIPCLNIGTPNSPICEGSPWNVVAYLASFPAGVAVYSAAAYLALRRRRPSSAG